MTTLEWIPIRCQNIQITLPVSLKRILLQILIIEIQIAIMIGTLKGGVYNVQYQHSLGESPRQYRLIIS